MLVRRSAKSSIASPSWSAITFYMAQRFCVIAFCTWSSLMQTVFMASQASLAGCLGRKSKHHLSRNSTAYRIEYATIFIELDGVLDVTR
ncbi:hypothetical protein M3S_J54 [Sorghum bicolor]|nr:hypothetical protein M3S_J54 [Sorghum bicolor]